VGGRRRSLNVVNQLAQTNERNTRGGSASILLWVGVVLIIYVASIGPAAWFHQRITMQQGQVILRTAYTPVVLLIERTPLKPRDQVACARVAGSIRHLDALAGARRDWHFLRGVECLHVLCTSRGLLACPAFVQVPQEWRSWHMMWRRRAIAIGIGAPCGRRRRAWVTRPRASSFRMAVPVSGHCLVREPSFSVRVNAHPEICERFQPELSMRMVFEENEPTVSI